MTKVLGLLFGLSFLTASPAHALVVDDVALGGDEFNCWLAQGKVHCWGTNDERQTEVPALTNPRKIAIGDYYGCALDDAGIKCWGANDYRQSEPRTEPNPREIGLGEYHGCARYDDRFRCWGFQSGRRTLVPAFGTPRLLAVGLDHNCAADESEVKCWGVDTNGETVVPADLGTVTLLAAGERVTCAIANGQPRCWGYDVDGMELPELDQPYLLASGRFYQCAADVTGVHCWGSYTNVQPRLADPPAGLTNLKGLWTKNAEACALTSAGEVKCWGMSDNAGFSPPDPTHVSAFDIGGSSLCATLDGKFRCWGIGGWTQIPEAPVPEQFDMGEGQVCTLNSGTVRCFGSNRYGEREVPADLTGVRVLASGLHHNCAATASQVVCWGDNTKGQAGTQALAGVSQLVLADEFSCALHQNQISCWGNTTWHQPNVPTPTASDKLMAGSDHVCVFGPSGLRCFGNNGGGQISEMPVLTAPKFAATGNEFTCVLDEGVVKCWDSQAPTITSSWVTPTELKAQGKSLCERGAAGIRCLPAFAGRNSMTFPPLPW